jgi:microcystin-dependent protein
MTLYKWSQTASSDATADNTINWAEGQPPSSVNDSARAMMAATAKYRDDIAGGIITGGSPTAYTVASFQAFDALARLANHKIAFVPHATNTNAAGLDATLNIDGLGAKPIRMAPGVALPNGTLVLGTPYIVTYNNSDAVFYLQNMTNPYAIPLAGGMDYWGTTAPNTSFAFPAGQAISRATYASLFAITGTTYGSGDGSTTFNLPDKRGRASASLDNMGGTTANRLVSGSMAGARHTLGGAGGADTHTLTTAEIPAVPFSGTTQLENSAHNHNVLQPASTGTGAVVNNTASLFFWTGGGGSTTGNENQGHAHAFNGNISGGGGGAHDILPPLILCNYIIRIL